MYAIPSSFAEFHRTGMEALIGFAQSQFAAFERLSTLNFKVARSAFNDGSTYAQALLATRDTPELTRLSAALALPALDRTIAYSLSVCELGSQIQGEMARLAEARATEFNAGMASGLDKLAKYAPAGSNVAVKAVKSALDTTSSALGSLSEFGMKTSDLAQAKFAAAAASVADADAKSSKANAKSSKANAKSSKANAKTGKDNSRLGKGAKRKAA